MGIDWITVDAAHVLSVMTLPTAAFYASWIAMVPSKEGRLDEIVAAVVSEFRAALLSNPGNVLDPDPKKLPLPCVRHAEILAIVSLCREMGQELSEIERRQLIRAEMNLRYFYAGNLLVSSYGRGYGTPSYQAGGRRPGGLRVGLPA